MILTNPSFEILTTLDYKSIIQRIEYAGRTCYKSENKITSNSAESFVKKIIRSGHESVIEHENISVKFICDRAVANELVRHRMASFSQESTRYVTYKNGVTYIIPEWIKDVPEGEYHINGDIPEAILSNSAASYWWVAMLMAENYYKNIIVRGWSPEKARTVLPSSTKTEIVTTANLREWRHILRTRCANEAHPQIRQIMVPLLHSFNSILPVIFTDLDSQNNTGS